MRSLSLLLFLTLALSAQSPAPGLRLYGGNNSLVTNLVDINGAVVHTWNSVYMPGQGMEIQADGSLLRSARITGGPVLGGVGGAVQRFSFDGTLRWEFHYHNALRWTHHDIKTLPNGNVLLIAWENWTVPQATAMGRNSTLITGTVVRTDSIIEVQPTGPTTGNVVWEWRVKDHLIQDMSATVANYGVVAQHPELVDINFPALANQANDINHVNGIDYDPENDWIILSSHNQHEIWIIDHSTTTAQAASHTGGNRGHGGDLLYRWGNPQAYDAGTAANQMLYGQHDPRKILPGRPGAGNITLFNNNYPGGSRVWEIALPMDSSGNFPLTPGAAYGPAAPLWSYSATGFTSTNISGCERLPNGNTLICSGAQGRLFEVTPAGATVWNYLPGGTIFHTHYVDRALWSSAPTLTLSTGGSVQFQLITGSNHANEAFVLLASATGTNPGLALGSFILPLNDDDLLAFTLSNANTPMLTNTFSALDAQGRALASLNLPPLVGLPNALPLNFAAVLFNPTTMTFTATSYAVPLTLLP
ncbi:MAG: arylsulfotransferase [Planctomycetes bacterium]|nr:arylsulfotransferase [Planctomycetota bacterium]